MLHGFDGTSTTHTNEVNQSQSLTVAAVAAVHLLEGEPNLGGQLFFNALSC